MAKYGTIESLKQKRIKTERMEKTKGKCEGKGENRRQNWHEVRATIRILSAPNRLFIFFWLMLANCELHLRVGKRYRMKMKRKCGVCHFIIVETAVKRTFLQRFIMFPRPLPPRTIKNAYLCRFIKNFRINFMRLWHVLSWSEIYSADYVVFDYV